MASPQIGALQHNPHRLWRLLLHTFGSRHDDMSPCLEWRRDLRSHTVSTLYQLYRITLGLQWKNLLPCRERHDLRAASSAHEATTEAAHAAVEANRAAAVRFLNKHHFDGWTANVVSTSGGLRDGRRSMVILVVSRVAVRCFVPAYHLQDPF